jgi:hypothetical protein
VLQLTRRVERIHVHLHGAGADDAHAGDRERRNVRHHDRDPIAFGDPELALQISGKRARQPIGLGKGQRLPEAPKRGLVRVALDCVFEQFHH